jgi:phenylacetate-CoA ligase
MMTWLSRHLFFPLWEIKDRAQRRRYLQELWRSQWLDCDALRERQWQRTCAALAYAFQYCPYYRDSFLKAGFDGVLRDRAQFQALPILTKQHIRENSEALRSRQFSHAELVESRTGGSTGKALTVYFDKVCQEQRNAAAMRSDRWAGWDLGMKVAAVWGNPPAADTLKKRLRSLLLERTFYLDTMRIDDVSIGRFVQQWRREQPQVLYGHAHSIYILAMYLRRLGAELRPRAVIATSMMLLEPERRVIEAVFGCAATNRYGCEELGLIASECEQHCGLHINVDHVLVEFLREDGTQAQPGEEANIVATDLINRGMPLIRYRLEDMGVAAAAQCACGRGLPVMERITGRQADFLRRADGSFVAGVSLVERTLTAIPGIEQMQLVQDDPLRVQVRVVKDSDFTQSSQQRLREELQAVFGAKMTIEIHAVKTLERTQSGKYRFAIRNVQ